MSVIAPPDTHTRIAAAERLLELGSEISAWLDLDGRIAAVNAAAERLLGHDVDGLVGRSWQELVHPGDLEKSSEFMAARLANEGESDCIVSRLRTASGGWVHFEWTIAAIDGAYYCTGRDLTERHEAEEKLQRTEALWRTVFERSTIGIALADGDGRLVEVNSRFVDLLGSTRDVLLGRNFMQVVAAADRAAAGESALRLWSGEVDRYEAERRYVRDDGGEVWGHTAVTLVETPSGEQRCLAQVLDISRRKLEEQRLAAQYAELRTLDRVRTALANGDLVLFAQPIVDLRTREVVREELLVRLDDGGTLLTPDQFLPVAEAHDLIGEIDLWVLGRSLELAHSGRPINVNVSPRSLGTPRLLDRVEAAVAAGLDPSSVCFEITETALADELDTLCDFAERAHKLGCGLAIDDFGVGYGSLLYLKNLEGLAALKIDQSFVARVLESETDQRIVDAVAGLANGLGPAVVAEGVEDEATAAYLLGRGITLGQGYGLGRPQRAFED